MLPDGSNVASCLPDIWFSTYEANKDLPTNEIMITPHVFIPINYKYLQSIEMNGMPEFKISNLYEATI